MICSECRSAHEGQVQALVNVFRLSLGRITKQREIIAPRQTRDTTTKTCIAYGNSTWHASKYNVYKLHVSRSTGLAKNHFARHSERGKKTRQTEGEVGRQHQGMDRPGVRQVPEGSGEQGKMEETGCEIICGAPTTLAVKG